jgi:hypothetical protein
MHEIKESDWKRLRQVHAAALDRFCVAALTRIHHATQATATTPHERYLTVFRVVADEDKRLAAIFDDLKRSSAVMHLVSMRAAGLVTDDEYAEFNQDLRDTVDSVLAP